jgi:intracellular septation protein
LTKLLFDLFPVILFFVAYKVAGAYPDASLALASVTLAPIIADGNVPADQAPILIATAVAIVASLLQVGWLLVRGRKVEPMLWLSLAVIVVFGGATIWLHDETFIKWKPSILYWLFAAILLAGRLVWNRNLIQSLLGTQLAVAAPVWERLLWAWIAFFAAIGAVNIAVAYSVPTATWVNFKLFGLLGLTFAFTLGIGFWLARHMKEAPTDA